LNFNFTLKLVMIIKLREIFGRRWDKNHIGETAKQRNCQSET